MAPHPATEKRNVPDETRFRARLFDAVLGLNAGRISWDDYDRDFVQSEGIPRPLFDLVYDIWIIYDPEYPGNRRNTPPEVIYRILLFIRSNELRPDKREERGPWNPFPSAASYAAADAAFGAEVFARFVADGAPGCTPEALRAAIDDCLCNGPPPLPVLRCRMPAARTLLWLVCLGIPLVFVAVLAGAALAACSTGLGRILGACLFYGLVWALPALFVLSRFAVVEIARTPHRGYRRRVLLCGVPLSVRSVPEGRLVRVQEAGIGGWHGVSGITSSARLCVACADGHHLLLGHFPCFLFGLDALPEAAFAPLGAAEK